MGHFKAKYGLLLLWGISLGVLFKVPDSRLDLMLIIPSYAAAFISYLGLRNKQIQFWESATVSLLLFLLLGWDYPIMSDDYYRFFWDGYLLKEGVNVYAYTPNELAGNLPVSPAAKEAFSHMNSPSYYAVYTPINELLYALPFYLGVTELNQFVWVLRVLFITTILMALFVYSNSNSSKINARGNLVLFNPLLWLEGLGNIHVEGILILFVLLCFVMLSRREAVAGIVGGIAVALKVTAFPVLLFFLAAFKRRGRVFLMLSLAILVVCSLALIGEISGLQNMMSSLKLFSENFEFNGSLYLLVNSLVSSALGYNAIIYVGKILNLSSLLVSGLLCYKIFRQKHWGQRSRWALMCQVLATVFLLCCTTVHPWYLLIPISFSVFVFNPFVIAWTGTVVLSYIYYQSYENGIWLWLEYLIPVAIAVTYRLKTGSWVKFHDSRL